MRFSKFIKKRSQLQNRDILIFIALLLIVSVAIINKKNNTINNLQGQNHQLELESREYKELLMQKDLQ